MPKVDVGHVDCPCCGEPAKVRDQKNGRAYMLCTSPVCGFQGFTRSDDADRHLRTKMRPIAQAVQELDQPKKGFFDDLKF